MYLPSSTVTTQRNKTSLFGFVPAFNIVSVQLSHHPLRRTKIKVSVHLWNWFIHSFERNSSKVFAKNECSFAIICPIFSLSWIVARCYWLRSRLARCMPTWKLFEFQRFWSSSKLLLTIVSSRGYCRHRVKWWFAVKQFGTYCTLEVFKMRRKDPNSQKFTIKFDISVRLFLSFWVVVYRYHQQYLHWTTSR